MVDFKFALREDLQGQNEFLPTREHLSDSGWDVRCADPNGVTLKAFTYVKIPLGFRSFCPPGYWYELKPRSSTFAKKHLHCLYGTIDEAFESELVFAAQFIPSMPYCTGNLGIGHIADFFSKSFTIEFGERIGQIIPVKRQDIEVVSISNEEFDKLSDDRNAGRKANGFGSTGDK